MDCLEEEGRVDDVELCIMAVVVGSIILTFFNETTYHEIFISIVHT